MMADTVAQHQPDMLTHALGYLARGLPVFPVCSATTRDRCLHHRRCAHPGKVPLVQWTFLARQERLPTEHEIRTWWARWPGANIGLATGALSGVVVLDADGTDGRKEALTRGGVEQTATVWTGRPGGTHFWLQHPGAPVRNFARKIVGLDFRGDGGYVVLPPSVHASGAHYRWVDGTEQLPLAPMPGWLRELVGGQVPPSKFSDGEPKTFSGGEPAEHQPLDLTSLLDGVPEGARDDTLYRLACKLRGENVPQPYAELLVRQSARLCRPPFDAQVAAEKVQRAYHDFQPHPTLDISDATPDGPAAGYPLQPISELVSGNEDVPEWLIDGLIPANRISWLFSSPGVGKTLFLVALGLHIAAGRKFCGRDVVAGPVLLIEEDCPLSSLASYVELLADIYEISLPPLQFWVNRTQGLRITTDEQAAVARQVIDGCPLPPVLLILDACERLVPSDRFNSKELDPLDRLLKWAANRGCTPIMADHTRRPVPGQGAPKTPEDYLELLYGGRTKSAIADVMIHLGGTLEQGAQWTWAKVRGSRADRGDIKLRFDQDQGFVLTEKPVAAVTPTEQQILRWMHNAPSGWHNKEEIIEQAHVAGRSAERALSSLVAKRWLLREGETRGGVQFRLNPQAGGPLG